MTVASWGSRAAALFATAVTAVLLVACVPAPPTPVRLTFDESVAGYANHGDAGLQVTIVSADGGQVVSAAGRTPGDGQSARFPAFDPTDPAARAVVRVTNTEASDRLNPGDGRFEFGTDLTLDAASADVSPESIDNGDNAVQRGLYGDVTQYKLELDRRQPACRIKGRAGELRAVAPLLVEPDRWYRVSCKREDATVTVTVWQWNADGTMTPRSGTASGPTGDLTPASPAVPLSVGGKLEGNSLVSATDQFNGRLDTTYLAIG